jgi:glucoamylase
MFGDYKGIFPLLGIIFGISTTPTNAKAMSFEEWVGFEEIRASKFMEDNISAPGTAIGSVIASPSREDPDYYYHWVRDAAAAMRVVVQQYKASTDSVSRQKYFQSLLDFTKFSQIIQQTPNRSGGVGEPKFNVDGSAYAGEWGRPQNDGPAARAIVLIDWADQLLKTGNTGLVRQFLYDGNSPTNTVIKTDLEYLSHHWEDLCFDLWEETHGRHFYTLIMTRRALLDGSRLAQQLNDDGASRWYLQQADAVGGELTKFWDKDRGYIVDTLDRDAGVDYKASNLDSSVVMGVLLGNTDDGIYPIDNPRVLATVSALERTFSDQYFINKRGYPGLAIGRYPEDRYDGYGTNTGGNPWVVLTAIFSQYYCRLALRYEQTGTLVVTAISANFWRDLMADMDLSMDNPITRDDPRFPLILRKLRDKADSYLQRIQFHANQDGSLSEQINRDTGFMQGAPHLSASYATTLWAIWARRNAFP